MSYSQNFRFKAKNGKRPVQPQKAANPLNQYFFDEMVKLKKEAECNSRFGFKISYAYKRVLSSLSKFPLPIIRLEQVQILDGVGEAIFNKFQQLFNQRITEFEKLKVLGDIDPDLTFTQKLLSEDNRESVLQFGQRLTQYPRSESNRQQSMDIEQPEGIGKKRKLKQTQIDQEAEKKRAKRKKEELLYEEGSTEWILLVFGYVVFEDKSKVTKGDFTSGGIVTYSEDEDEKSHYLEENQFDILRLLIKEGSYKKNGKYYTISEDGMIKARELIRRDNYSVDKSKKDDGIFVILRKKVGQTQTPKPILEDKKIQEEAKIKGKESKIIEPNRQITNEPKGEEALIPYQPNLSHIEEIEDSIDQIMQRSEIETFINTHTSPLSSQTDINYKVILIVDNREIRNAHDRSYIYDLVRANQLPCEQRTMSLGDIVWILRIEKANQKGNEQLDEAKEDDEDTSSVLSEDEEPTKEFILDFIIERKTANDLASSIIDGRYAEQKTRLKNCGIKNVLYLIEGCPTINSRLPGGPLNDASLETQIRTGFNLVRVQNPQVFPPSNRKETLHLLVNMTEEIEKKIQQMSMEEIEKSFVDYSEFQNEMNKSTGLTISKVFARQMRVIKGSSFDNSLLLQKVFQTPRRLYEIYQTLAGERARARLLNSAKFLYFEYYKKESEILNSELKKHTKPQELSRLMKRHRGVGKINKKISQALDAIYNSLDTRKT